MLRSISRLFVLALPLAFIGATAHAEADRFDWDAPPKIVTVAHDTMARHAGHQFAEAGFTDTQLAGAVLDNWKRDPVELGYRVAPVAGVSAVQIGAAGASLTTGAMIGTGLSGLMFAEIMTGGNGLLSLLFKDAIPQLTGLDDPARYTLARSELKTRLASRPGASASREVDG